jgi:nitroimidazol reductase NimA-like FMN-containing flavoprotein (pyridoxamine 5'-phosphate oxidase superfamily)
MNPTTELDESFSQPGATPTAWDKVRRALETAEVSWIATVRVDGRPHVTPLVVVFHDDAAYFCTGAGEQKAVNLRTNANVVLTTGCNNWQEGLDVVVEGEAVRIVDDDRLRELAEAWKTKWDGQWQFEARDGAFHHDGGAGEALVFEVVPTKVLSFSKSDGAATRHRFKRG